MTMTKGMHEQYDKAMEAGREFFEALELLGSMKGSDLKMDGVVKNLKYHFNEEMKVVRFALNNTEAMALRFPDATDTWYKVRQQKGKLSPKQIKLLVSIAKTLENERLGAVYRREQELMRLMGFAPRKCGETKKDGQPCSADSLRFVDPPVCSSHATPQQRAFNQQKKADALTTIRRNS